MISDTVSVFGRRLASVLVPVTQYNKHMKLFAMLASSKKTDPPEVSTLTPQQKCKAGLPHNVELRSRSWMQRRRSPK